MIKRNLVLIIMISIIIIIFSTYYIYFYTRGDYVQYFDREYTTETERNAIYAAEGLNYSQFFGLPQFNEDWTTNFIDSDVLDFYNMTFERAKDKNEDIDLEYRYLAMSEYHDNFNITVNNELYYMNLTINGEQKKVINHKGYGLIYSDELVYVKYMKGFNQPPVDLEESLGKLSHEIEFRMDNNYTNAYFVEMYLSYKKTWGERSGSLIETYQLVVLDENYNVKMIILFPPE